MQFILTALQQMFGLISAVGQIYKMCPKKEREKRWFVLLDCLGVGSLGGFEGWSFFFACSHEVCFPQTVYSGVLLGKKGWPQYALAASPELVRHVFVLCPP